MKQKIVTTLLAAAAVIAPVSTSAQKYYARQAIGKGSAAAPISPTVCDAPKPLYTISDYGTLKSQSASKPKTLAQAKAACETEAGATVCYIIEDTTPATGSAFYPITSAKGTVGYVGSFAGQVNYASYCRPK